MGAFVLGILVGWLAEWLFYTFWVKTNDGDGDCSELKAELELKNRQISSLQTQISAKRNSASSTKNSKKTTVTSVASSSKARGSKTNKKTQGKTKPSAAKSRTAAKTRSTSTSTSTAKNNSATNKTKPSAKRKSKITGDDFTKISGIGPSMSATLKTLGIDTFKKLAATDDDTLRNLLESSGARMNNNKDVMDSWNEQATLAAKGDFARLKQMQEAMKK